MNNPKLILFTGFLGSGKTSLLLKTARHLAQQQKQCAIIVNEVGEIGIDNLQMKKMGYDVWEIFGGCVCCTLAVSLEETIEKLTANYAVEYILMEPSGAADPKALFQPLKHCGFAKENLNNVFILDPTRVEMFEAVLEPYLESSIPLADIAVINKIDVATAPELEKSEAIIRKYNQTVPVLKINVNELSDNQIEEILK
ncbi:CobW family GTP-binding protein [Acetobacterium bakii]|uniref:Cobalamin biosynthesis protein CobW n=1 Tax=Acetobacterium bakii TaxID=52689 RepID=A0A0L6U1A8_9FIRM|nr:GTP-binding protein [Acetobacterium bakii]KNZ42289.1 cobalamin biosynthesis protein CobW [Acetobacterium bakii]